MSGGHFNYYQYHIGQIADAIKLAIENNDSEELDQYGCELGRGYSTEVINKFKHAVNVLSQAEIIVQRIDWLLSGDDGEDNFIQRLDAEMKVLDL